MPTEMFLLPLLFFTGLTAGLVDAIAGGGGLITLPVLLSIGLPPKLALGTNKFQSSFGSFTATYHYTRQGVANPLQAKLGIVMTLIGAGVGAWAVQQIESDVLSGIVPFLLIAIVLYTLFTPKLGEVHTKARISERAFYVLSGLALGFYDGFFGPGVGSFWAILFVFGLGFDLIKATGYTKVMNFASNIISFVVFLVGGHIWFVGGACMAVGQILGARIGSGLAIKRGARFIRPLYITVVLATIAKLVWGRWG
jgi:uncharacterized membrane protein YfcA